MKPPTPEIDAYLDGDPTPEQTRALEAWIQADPAHAKAFLAAVRLHQQIGSQLRKDRFDLALRSPSQPATTKDGDAAIQALASLVEMEAAAEPLPLDAIERPLPFKSPRNRPARTETNLMQALDDLRWATGKVTGQLIRTPLGITAAIAAALLLALILINPLTNNTPPNPPASTQSTPPNSTPTTTSVATLTAQHNAQWAQAEGALAPGSHPHTGDALAAGQRLNLTQGFAEITTKRGAIAILEAPATIELLDNDNAIRLHAGKLVGICETPSSKGFLVRTPHMDIKDLGTRFGVDVSRADATQVHVFEGEVEVARVDAPASSTPQRLVAGESVSASASSAAIARIEYEPARFAVLTRATLPMQGTGVGITVGEADPRWLVISEDGRPLDTPQPLVVSDNPGLAGGLPNVPESSQWLSFNPMRDAPRGQTLDYVIQTRIELPAAVDPASARLILNFAADNQLAAIIVNGNRIEITSDAPSGQWTKLSPVVVPGQHLRPGDNTIGFVVSNFHGGNAQTNFVALRLQWQVQTQIRLTPSTNELN